MIWYSRYDDWWLCDWKIYYVLILIKKDEGGCMRYAMQFATLDVGKMPLLWTIQLLRLLIYSMRWYICFVLLRSVVLLDLRQGLRIDDVNIDDVGDVRCEWLHYCDTLLLLQLGWKWKGESRSVVMFSLSKRDTFDFFRGHCFRNEWKWDARCKNIIWYHLRRTDRTTWTTRNTHTCIPIP